MDLAALLAAIQAHLAIAAELRDAEWDTTLADFAAQLREAATPLAAAENATDEQLADLQSIADTLTTIGTAQAERTAAATERADRQRALADSIAAMTDDPDETDPEADPADAVETDPADATPAPDAADQPLPVAASPAAPVITRVAARRPAAAAPPAVQAPETRLSLVAAGTFDTIEVGTPLNSPADIARAFLAAASTSRGYRGPRVKIPVVRAIVADATWQDQDRWLGRDPIQNERTILANLGAPGSLTASGGICAPQQVNYDLPTIGSTARPVRDGAMARFGADRGGIRTLPIIELGDVDGAVSVWDHATDLAPEEETKDCLTIVCADDEDETLVEAIVRCLQTGNFRARYFPEQIQAWLDLAAVSQARLAENRLLSTIGTGSTAVTAEKVVGATRDILTTLDRALAGFASRWRDDSVRMRWVAPFWLRALIRTDIARQMPVGTLDETLALADVAIDRWFAARPNLSVTWHMDGETGQIFGAQGDGPLLGWPDDVITYLYPEGTWLFLDGGQLDLGIVRDSTLNSTNDFQMFAETFEGAHRHGIESFRITHDVCADGSASALIDIDPCTTGS